MQLKPTIYLNISYDRINWYKIDVDESTTFAINMAVQDIADFSNRKGSGSYKITLANTKQNQINLKHVFDVKSNDLSLVKNKVYCQVIKNDSLLFDNYYFVLEEADMNNEKTVITYKARIFNALTNFYQSVDSLYLSDLDLSRFDHVYTSSNIAASFNNTYVNGYKYSLPYNYSSTPYQTKDFFPTVYARTYFDEIHKQAGFTYSFNEATNPNVRFNQLVHPFVGDLKKVVEDEYSNLDTEVRRTNTVTENFSSGVGAGEFNISRPLSANEEVKDPENTWSITPLTEYTIPVAYNNMQNPNHIKFNIQLNWDVLIRNNNSFNLTNDINQNANFTTTQCDVFLEAYNATTNTLIQETRLWGDVNPGVDVFQISSTQPTGNYMKPFGNTSLAPNQEKLLYGTDNNIQNHSFVLANLPAGTKVLFRVRMKWKEPAYTFTLLQSTAGTQIKPIPANKLLLFRYKSIRITQTVVVDHFLVGVTLPFNKIIPSGIKQTDYLLALYNMFNIYGEPDPLNERHIIYKTRNVFYETGKDLGDLTNLVDYSKQVNIKYIPDINEKTVILTYKQDDKDAGQKQYKETTEETISQQEIIYDNKNVKGTKTRSIIFSSSLNVDTSFGANVPLLPLLPNVNMRVWLDNGKQVCGNYKIQDTTSGINLLQLNEYPFMSMQDHPSNPTFSIEYGPNEYYLYNNTYTFNNLFFNHFYNMFEQINTGSLVTLYMNLDDKFISTVRMNDRFTIDNKQYYFNKIIEYQPHIPYTKVELLSADDVLITPKIGKKPGGVIVKPGVSLEDTTVTFVDTLGNILDSVFEPNPTNDDIIIQAEDTATNVIFTETATPMADSKEQPGTFTTGVVSTGIKWDYLQHYRERNNINYDETNILLGDNNIVTPGVKDSFVLGSNKVIDKSNSFYVDNIEADMINGLPIGPLINILAPGESIKDITRTELLEAFEPGTYNIINPGDGSSFIKVKIDNDLKTTYWRDVTVPNKLLYTTNPNQELYHHTRTYAINKSIIYGNKVWINITGNNGAPLSIYELNDTDWVLDDTSTYETITVYYDYDIQQNILYSAYEPIKNNRLTNLFITDYSLVTDWNHPYMNNNIAQQGIFNNCSNIIQSNRLNGICYNNVGNIVGNQGLALYGNNTLSGIMYNTFTNGSIINVKATTIEGNVFRGAINCSIQNFMSYNYLTGTIQNLTNIVTYVAYNRCNNITNASLTAGPITETLTNK